jgi:hypothetical protein
MTGIIFFAKEITDDVMKKYNLIMIPFPIHDDLNTSYIEPGKISLFFSEEQCVFRHNNLSENWSDIDETDVVTEFNNGNQKWFIDKGAIYTYICVKKIINSSRIDVPRPYDDASHSVSIMYNYVNDMDKDDITRIEEIYGHNGEIHGIIDNVPLRLCDIVLSSSSDSCSIKGLDILLKK